MAGFGHSEPKLFHSNLRNVSDLKRLELDFDNRSVATKLTPLLLCVCIDCLLIEIRSCCIYNISRVCDSVAARTLERGRIR